MSNVFTGSAKYAAITAWAALTAQAAGVLRRQLATPATNSERVFACIIAGTTLASEPSWSLTKGAITAEAAGPSWQECTGEPGVNGNIAGTPDWNIVKNTAVALGKIIKDIAGTHLFICSGAGTCGNGAEPSWGTTAGNTTADNTATWTCLGLASAFASFAAPHARLANAYAATWSAAGDTFYIDDTHSETQSTNMTITCPGTSALPSNVLCITGASANSPVLSTGGQVKTTSTGTLRIGGVFYMYGVTIDFGSNFVSMNGTSATKNVMHFENCLIKQSNTSSGASIALPGGTPTPDGAYAIFRNCTFTFGQVANYIAVSSGNLVFDSCIFAATGTIPTALFSGQYSGTMIVRNCDLSNINTALISNTGSSGYNLINIQNCKINASVAVTTGTNTNRGGMHVKLHNCDSGGTNYKYNEVDYTGSVITETTTIRTSGGATDGTTPQSMKAVTTNANAPFPLEVPHIAQWNSTTGAAKTATVEIAGGAALTNADIWLELDYLGSASSPQGSVVSNKVASVLTTPANHTTSSETWGGAPASKQKLSVTFTPQQEGPIKARIFVAKASTTVYIDPLITIT